MGEWYHTQGARKDRGEFFLMLSSIENSLAEIALALTGLAAAHVTEAAKDPADELGGAVQTRLLVEIAATLSNQFDEQLEDRWLRVRRGEVTREPPK